MIIGTAIASQAERTQLRDHRPVDHSWMTQVSLFLVFWRDPTNNLRRSTKNQNSQLFPKSRLHRRCGPTRNKAIITRIYDYPILLTVSILHNLLALHKSTWLYESRNVLKHGYHETLSKPPALFSLPLPSGSTVKTPLAW